MLVLPDQELNSSKFMCGVVEGKNGFLMQSVEKLGHILRFHICLFGIFSIIFVGGNWSRDHQSTRDHMKVKVAVKMQNKNILSKYQALLLYILMDFNIMAMAYLKLTNLRDLTKLFP